MKPYKALLKPMPAPSAQRLDPCDVNRSPAPKWVFNLVILVMAATMVLACGGGAAKPVTPGHLAAGMRQIKKGNDLYQRGCYQRSLDHYLRANEKFSMADQTDGVAMSLNNIGNVYRVLGETASAILFFDEAYQTYANLQDSRAMVRVLANKAAILLDTGELDTAESVITAAEKIARNVGMTDHSLTKNKGILLAKRGRYPAAETLLTDLLETVDPANLPEIASVNGAIANVLVETDRPEEAIEFLQAALAADQWTGFYTGMADDLAAIGAAYHQLGDNRSSGNYYQRSLKIYALIGSSQKVAQVLDQLEIIDTTTLDLSVTKHFVERWLKGEADRPCE